MAKRIKIKESNLRDLVKSLSCKKLLGEGSDTQKNLGDRNLNSAISRVILREHMFGSGYGPSSSSNDWDLARAYALGGKHLLSESSKNRGKLLMESLVSGLASAVSLAGHNISNAINSFKDKARDVKEYIGRVYTKILAEIPSGEMFFEIFKNFSKSALEQVGEAIKDKIEEIGADLTKSKQSIIETLLSKEIFTEDLYNKVKNSAKNSGKEILEWISLLKKEPGEATKQLFVGGRELLSSFAAKMFEFILKKSPTAKAEITKLVRKIKSISDPKTGKLAIGIIRFATGDLGNLEDTVKTATMIWTGSQIARDQSGTLSQIHPRDLARSLVDFLPKSLYGILSGNNPVEVLVKTFQQDYTKIIKIAIRLGVQAVQKMSESKIDSAMLSVGIDEGSKTWKAVRMGALGLIGLAAGTAGAAATT
jgi:hypothetical protein